jgi:5-methylcytosine-specific restriction protein A
MNLRAVHTGKGLTNVSAMDRAIWGEFGNKREELFGAATLIRNTIEDPGVELNLTDEEEFSEGGLLTRRHKSRERNKNIRKKLLSARKTKGQLVCEMCELSPTSKDQRFLDTIFEAHHIVPLAQATSNITRLKDMALLCANCHRLIHRAISLEKRWLSISEARNLLF